METKKKIIIVENNDLHRTALKDLINAQEHLEVVSEAGSGGEALKIIKQSPADLVLLDSPLPGRSGSSWVAFNLTHSYRQEQNPKGDRNNDRSAT